MESESESQPQSSDTNEFKRNARPLVSISKEVEFDAGHRVPAHKSKCRNPHGHRYRVRVLCEGVIQPTDAGSTGGMLVDFGDLKYFLQTLAGLLDHAMIIWKGDDELLEAFRGHDWNTAVFEYVPTAENIARWFYDELSRSVNARYVNDLRVSGVSVWETPTSCAHYRGDRG